jgi:hypothetical protein
MRKRQVRSVGRRARREDRHSDVARRLGHEAHLSRAAQRHGVPRRIHIAQHRKPPQYPCEPALARNFGRCSLDTSECRQPLGFPLGEERFGVIGRNPYVVVQKEHDRRFDTLSAEVALGMNRRPTSEDEEVDAGTSSPLRPIERWLVRRIACVCHDDAIGQPALAQDDVERRVGIVPAIE